MPVADDFFRRGYLYITEHVGVPALQLADETVDNILDIKGPRLTGNLGVKHHLQ